MSHSLSLGRCRAFLRKYVIGTSTRSGRWFDVGFIIAVLVGVIALILDSVPSINHQYGAIINSIEVLVGTCFVLEYLTRVWVASAKLKWIFSFWGLLDLIAILPFLFHGFGFAYLRSFRILRVFSIFKVVQYSSASDALLRGLLESRSKIGVFVFSVVIFETVLAFTMHGIERETFPTVPDAFWWVVVTVTTVGYGDIVPTTVAGKVIAGLAMITSFGIIAVPAGIVAGEIAQGATVDTHRCNKCREEEHLFTANYCHRCGEPIELIKEA